MSFLFIKHKANAQSLPASSVSTSRLSALLCPYQGEIATVSCAGGDLYLSELAGPVTAGTVTIPFDTLKNPQTAWAEFKLQSDLLNMTTDPMGMFPIWMYESDDVLIITSEVKALQAITPGIKPLFQPDSALLSFNKRPANFSPFDNVRRIQPGAQLQITAQATVIEEGGIPLIYDQTPFPTVDASKAALTKALLHSAQQIAGAAPRFTTFLSGGIDSSTATALINRLQPGVDTYTLGTEFGDEYAEAADLADWLGIPHHRVFADEAAAKRHFARAIACNETVDGLTAETLAQLSVLAEAAKANGSIHIVTGYGADLLYGSMLRHELYMQVTGVDDLQSLIERTCWTGEFSPFFAWSLGLRVHHLFWDPALMNQSFRIPYDQSYDGKFEKVVLRSIAVENGWMRPEQAFRKKYALTDGTQFNRVLSNNLGLDDKHAYSEKTRCSIQHLTRTLLATNPF